MDYCARLKTRVIKWFTRRSRLPKSARRPDMKIEINSVEYQCWHETGHATVCLDLGGDVEFIELIDDKNSKGLARARCATNQIIRQRVACGGFATEFVLSREGYLQPIDEKEFTQIVFRNGAIDREMFHNRVPSKGESFTKEEDERFMYLAVNEVATIIKIHLREMRLVVGELLTAKKLTGQRVKEILRI